MQMIDVMKRLAELDSTNPNIVKENIGVEECGPMGMMGSMEKPSTPATLNITADSGEELGSMLAAIMKLAGVQQVSPEHLGAEPEPSMMTAEPISVVGPHAPEQSAGDDMRNMMSVVDKLNPEQDGEEGDEEETDEGKDEFGIPGVDNTPNRPDAHKSFDGNEFANHPNDGSTHGRATKNNPHGNPMGHEQEKEQGAHMTMEQQLMNEYKQFMAEDMDSEEYVACIVAFNRSGQAMVRRSKPVDKAKAEEIIANAKANNTFVHPPFMTIYPASAGKLDGSSIMKQFPDMSKENDSSMMEAKECKVCHEPMKKCKCD